MQCREYPRTEDLQHFLSIEFRKYGVHSFDTILHEESFTTILMVTHAFCNHFRSAL